MEDHKFTTSSRLESCLRIIALAIVADGYIRTEEIDSFTMAAQKLPAFKDKTHAMSNIQLLAWYNASKVKLIALRHSDDYADWLHTQLDWITD